MAWWNRKKKKEIEIRDVTLEDLFLNPNSTDSTISRDQAMSIPAFNYGVNLISDILASIPIKLYKKDGNKVKCMDDDPRVQLLNTTTGDTLDGYQMKKAITEDHIIYGAGYIYKNMARNTFKSLHYVDNPQVGIVLLNPDPIFKKLEFVIYGNVYKDFEMVKFTRKTRNGLTGVGLLEEANKLLSVAYNTLVFEDMLVSAGGNKKGFLKSVGRLSPTAIDELKAALKKFYSNNSDNFMVLNSGLEFQEANNSSVEMQINQNKITNNDEIGKMLGIPVELLDGKATGGNDQIFESFIKLAILPKLKALETALNKDLLLEKEKGSFYFAGDTTELVKADILKRFQAYQLAIDSGILQVDEIRSKEGYEPLGFDFVKLGLQDVLYNPQTQQIYTPNTNKMAKMGEDPQVESVPSLETGGNPAGNPQDVTTKGGETIANRDPGGSGPT